MKIGLVLDRAVLKHVPLETPYGRVSDAVRDLERVFGGLQSFAEVVLDKGLKQYALYHVESRDVPGEGRKEWVRGYEEAAPPDFRGWASYKYHYSKWWEKDFAGHFVYEVLFWRGASLHVMVKRWDGPDLERMEMVVLNLNNLRVGENIDRRDSGLPIKELPFIKERLIDEGDKEEAMKI